MFDNRIHMVPFSAFASAITLVPLDPADLGVPSYQKGFEGLLEVIANALLGVVGTAAALMLIIGGLMYIFSLGNEEQTEKAKKTITWAIRGVVIAAVAWSVIKILVTATPLAVGP